MQHWTPDDTTARDAAPPSDAWSAWLNHLPARETETRGTIRPGLGMFVGAGLSGFWLALGAVAWRVISA